MNQDLLLIGKGHVVFAHGELLDVFDFQGVDFEGHPFVSVGEHQIRGSHEYHYGVFEGVDGDDGLAKVDEFLVGLCLSENRTFYDFFIVNQQVVLTLKLADVVMQIHAIFE